MKKYKMKNTLWIPAYNEWNQIVNFAKPKYFGYNNEKVEENRSNIYETLKLIKPKIDLWIFDKVIITNDWSNDDTIDEIDRFKKENYFGQKSFIILNHDDNQWKVTRFSEAYKLANQYTQDIFIMTDADMAFLPNDNFFEKLSQSKIYKNIFSDKNMMVSLVNECNWLKWYDTFMMDTSWTRSLIIPQTIRELQDIWLYKWWLPAQWYWLELMLNLLFGDKSEYINNINNNQSIPHFLQAMRKWNVAQKKDIAETKKSLITYMRERWISINRNYLQL